MSKMSKAYKTKTSKQILPLREQMSDSWRVAAKFPEYVIVSHPEVEQKIRLYLQCPCTSSDDYEVGYLFDLSEPEMKLTGGMKEWNERWAENDRYEWHSNPLVQIVEVEDTEDIGAEDTKEGK